MSVLSDIRSIQLAAYMDLKLLTDLRQGDMLALRIDQLKDDGVHVLVCKTKRQIMIRWSDHLKAAVEAVIIATKTTFPAKEDPFLFCTRRGEQYTSDGKTGGFWKRHFQNARKS